MKNSRCPSLLAVSDYNFGTLIRTDASDEYTQFNTTFGEHAERYMSTDEYC